MTDEPTNISVGTSSPYDVVVGRGLWDRLPGLLGAEVRRVAVLHPEPLAARGEAIGAVLADNGYEPHLIAVPDGEQAKTAETAAVCWKSLGGRGFTRADAIVSVGGGATTDLAGFVAATWLRGVRVVHLPTTLLGMVDAAVGGKTGINTAAGKNLVGAFHQPAGVLCDLDALATLPPVDLVAGLAEVVKCGFVADPAILDLVESSPDAASDPASAVLRELVERAVRVKVDVVVADPHESGARSAAGEVGRERLNYGHTFGHAVEQVERYAWRHGDAVAVGMVFVAELARHAGRLDPETTSRHRWVLELVGLPTSYRGDVWPDLERAMRVDKKARGDRLRFVVLDGVAQPGLLEAPDPDLLTAAYEAVSR